MGKVAVMVVSNPIVTYDASMPKYLTLGAKSERSWKPVPTNCKVNASNLDTEVTRGMFSAELV